MKSGYVYILASKRNGTLYVGVTSNLIKRIYQHKNRSIVGFTSKYGVYKLVYFEKADDITVALQREKNIKRYPRKWKLNLIEKTNPEWKDLHDCIV